MQESGEGDAVLVVLEAGAKWPACASEYQQGRPNAVVEVQPETEPRADFRARVERRIADIKKRGAVQVALIAANGSFVPDAIRERYHLAKLLAKSMDGHGELVLTAALKGASADRVRQELFLLAGALCDELRGAQVSVSVRFSESSDESGMRPSYHGIDELEAASQ